MSKKEIDYENRRIIMLAKDLIVGDVIVGRDTEESICYYDRPYHVMHIDKASNGDKLQITVDTGEVLKADSDTCYITKRKYKNPNEDLNTFVSKKEN